MIFLILFVRTKSLVLLKVIWRKSYRFFRFHGVAKSLSVAAYIYAVRRRCFVYVYVYVYVFHGKQRDNVYIKAIDSTNTRQQTRWRRNGGISVSRATQ